MSDFRRARIEELPFDDGWFDVVISNGVVHLSADKRRVFTEVAGVLRRGGRLALADIVTERQIAARTESQAELLAACIAGASQRDLYLADITAAGLELQLVQPNSAHRFAQRSGAENEREVRRDKREVRRAKQGRSATSRCPMTSGRSASTFSRRMMARSDPYMHLPGQQPRGHKGLTQAGRAACAGSGCLRFLELPCVRSQRLLRVGVFRATMRA